MERVMSLEMADNRAANICAQMGGYSEMPLPDEFGFDTSTDEPGGVVYEALIAAHRASRWNADDDEIPDTRAGWTLSYPYGQLVTMLEYGVVDPRDIEQAIFIIRRGRR